MMLQRLETPVPTPFERFDVVVFSNRAIFSYAFKKLIEESTSLRVSLLPTYVAYCSRIDEAFSGLLVISLETVDPSGIEILRHIRESLPLARILLVLPPCSEVLLMQNIQSQVHSIWTESSTIPELLEATIMTLKGSSWVEKVPSHSVTDSYIKDEVQSIHQGNILVQSRELKHLTEREIQILKLMSEGHSNQGIAEHLFISISTVKNHSARLFTKLGTRNRTAAVIKAIETGLISRDTVCIS